MLSFFNLPRRLRKQDWGSHHCLRSVVIAEKSCYLDVPRYKHQQHRSSPGGVNREKARTTRRVSTQLNTQSQTSECLRHTRKHSQPLMPHIRKIPARSRAKMAKRSRTSCIMPKNARAISIVVTHQPPSLSVLQFVHSIFAGGKSPAHRTL